MSYKVKTIPQFERNLKKLVKKYPSLKNEFIQLISSLKEKPEQGTALGKNCFKIRLAIASKGKGKSGGARVITNIIISDTTVYLLAIYDKANKENLSSDEYRTMNNSDRTLFAPWIDWYPEPWCDIINGLTSSACFEQSLLELWGYEESTYQDLTEESILAKVNEKDLISAVFQTPITITDYLGEVTVDEEGKIIGAKATFMQWFGKINVSDLSTDSVLRYRVL